MKRIVGVAAACSMLAVSGCGGVPELDPDEIEIVSQARSAAETAVASGSLKPGDEEALEQLMILCHEKPLAEADGDSMREVMTEIAPRLKSADPAFSRRMQRVANRGCD